MGNYMLAPEQPIENRNYAYDEDIVSDDGRIWLILSFRTLEPTQLN